MSRQNGRRHNDRLHWVCGLPPAAFPGIYKAREGVRWWDERMQEGEGAIAVIPREGGQFEGTWGGPIAKGVAKERQQGGAAAGGEGQNVGGLREAVGVGRESMCVCVQPGNLALSVPAQTGVLRVSLSVGRSVGRQHPPTCRRRLPAGPRVQPLPPPCCCCS